MARLKNAPNMKAQDFTGESPVIICLGSHAWDIAKHIEETGKSADEIALDSVFHDNGDEPRPPVVITAEMLAQLEEYRIAPEKTDNATLILANNGAPLDTETLERVYIHLAQTTQAETVRYCNEAGELIEDISRYIKDIRAGRSSHWLRPDVVEEMQDLKARAKPPKDSKPYIEKRTEDGRKGLYFIVPKFDKDTGALLSESVQWLSDCVDVVGLGRLNDTAYLVVKFIPENASAPIIEPLPMEELGEREGWKRLKKRGLNVTASSAMRTKLADYLQTSGGREPWFLTNCTGWQNGVYILPNGEILQGTATSARNILFIGKSAGARGYTVQGTAESWREAIADKVRLNFSMMLGVASALSAPLIGLIKGDSFGVHLFGGSTSGKTTTANIASSIYGEPDQIRLTWFATGFGLTNEAQAHNDGFMPIDEIGQASNPKAVNEVAYTLFNGVGKIQGAKEEGNRELMRWRTVAFSTGETDLETYLTSKGVKTHAGQLVRLLNIPVHRAMHYHGLKDGKAHADYLNEMSKQHYGVMGRAWLHWLVDNQAYAIEQTQANIEKWLSVQAENVSSQVKRVATRFAILESALLLSQHLTGWTADEINQAILKAFNDWLAEFGTGDKEINQVIEQVVGYLQRYGASRFTAYPFDPNEREPADKAGYRVLEDEGKGIREHFYIFKQPYHNEVIAGFNDKQANEILHSAGMLEAGKEKKYRYLNRIPSTIDSKRPRAYLVYPLIEEEETDTKETE